MGKIKRVTSSALGFESPEETLARLESDTANLGRRLGAVGLDPNPPAPKESLLTKTLKVLNVPGAAVRSVISEGVDDEQGVDLGRAFSRERLWNKPVESIDILNQVGLMTEDNPDTKWDNFGRGVANFVGNVATDPLTFLSGGLVGGLKAGVPFGAQKALTTRGLAQVARIPEAAKAVRASALGQRYVEPTAQALGKMFSTTYGRNPALVAGRKALENRVTRRTEELQGALKELAKKYGLSGEEQNVLTRLAEEPEFRKTALPMSLQERVQQLVDGGGLDDLMDKAYERMGVELSPTNPIRLLHKENIVGELATATTNLNESGAREILVRNFNEEGGRAISNASGRIRPEVKQAWQELEGVKRSIITEPELQRGILEEGTLRENYQPHVNIAREKAPILQFGRKISADDVNTLKREIEGTVESINAERAAAGKGPLFDPNALTSTLVRGARAIKAVESYDFVKDVLGQYGKPLQELAQEMGVQSVDDAAKALPNGYVLWEGSGNLAQLGKVVVPQDVADELSYVAKFYSGTTDEGTNAFLGMVDFLTNKWKPFVTLRNPAFHVNNLIGNSWNAFLGGIDGPQRFIQGFDALRGGQGAVKTAAGTLSYEDLRNLARDFGVTGHTFFSEANLQKMVAELADQTGAITKGTGKKFDDLMHRFGTNIEDGSKMALFIDQMAKVKPAAGLTGQQAIADMAQQAALHTKKYLFDYSDLTPFEKNVMKRIAPFYSWTRFNLPLQIVELLNQPGKFSGLRNLKASMQEMSDDPNEPRPTYLEEAVRLPWKTKDGTPLYFNPRLPAQDISRIPFIGPGDTGREMFGMLNPLFKLPAELTFNKSLYTGRDIERYPDETVAMPGGVRLPAKTAYAINSTLGVAGKTGAALQAFAPDADATDTLRVVRTFFPGLYTYNPQKERVNQAYAEVRRLQDLQRKYRDESGQRVPTLKQLGLSN